MIFEFLGLPGAGKTTLCEDLRGWLAGIDTRLASTTVPTNRNRLSATIGIFLYWRAALVAARALIASPRSWHSKRLAARWFLSTLSFYTPRRRNRPFLVLDEGLLQRSFLLFMEQDGFGSVDRVGRYIEAIPLPDVVVAVDLSPAESLARVRHRTRLLPRRFQSMAENDQLTAFNQGAELLDLVLARALDRADSSTQVIRIPGNDLEQAKRRLAAEIAEKLRIRVPQP